MRTKPVCRSVGRSPAGSAQSTSEGNSNFRRQVWRGAVTALFVVLLVWGDLPRGLEEFLPISLGTGILIMGAELIRNTAAAPIS